MTIPADQYELYAEFGIAAEKAQVLEIDAGNVALSFLAFFFKTNELTTEQIEMFRSIDRDLNRKTLGALLKYVKTTANIDDYILQALDDALEKRNFLTHKFFLTHNFAIYSAVGRKEMIQELKEIQNTLGLAHWMLHGLSEGLDKLSGKSGVDLDLVKQLETQGKRLKLFQD
jgi:hypothetical protein